jgi:hypothetical protein
MPWSPPLVGSSSDATTSTKGVVQLAGDLAGTAAAPTVVPYLKPFFSILDPAFGAKCDGKRITDAGITSGQAILTSATAAFVAGDVGKTVLVEAAGASGGTLLTTIQSRTNATTVVLAANAGSTVSNARAEYGTDDKTAIDAAITAAVAAGLNARIPGNKTTFSSGGHAGVPGFHLEGQGQVSTKVRHIGNNVFFKYTEGVGITPKGTNTGGARDFSLLGNPGATAVGIQISDTFGAKLRRIVVGSRPISATGIGDFDCYNGGGVAYLLQNESYWTEGTVFDECGSMFNDVALRFQNHLNADPTKNNSFAYTKLKDFFCQVPTNGIGWDFGGPDDNPILVYHGEFVAHIWGSQSPTQVNNVCVLVRKQAHIPPTTRFAVKGEIIGGSGNIWVRNIGDGTNGGKLNASGHLRAYRDAGCTDDLQAASETLLHLSANAPLALDPSAAVPGTVGLKDSGTGAWRQTHAITGATSKTNEEATYTGGYSFTNAPVHRFLALTLNAHTRGPFNVDTFTKSWIRADGALCLGTVADYRVFARNGSSTPEGNTTGSRGDVVQRTLTTGASLYAKSQGDVTNTGWVCISALKGTKVFDWGSAAAEVLGSGDTLQTTVTVTGAAVGDFAMAAMDILLPQGVFLTAQVSAVDTVQVTLVDGSSSAVDLVSANLNVRVQKN